MDDQNASNALWACATLGHLPDRDWMALLYDAMDAKIESYGPQASRGALAQARNCEEDGGPAPEQRSFRA